MDDLKRELKDIIINAANLEDVTPEEIENDAPLFVEGLGLDSIDALELGVAIQKEYGVKIDPEDPNVRDYFRSVRSLARYVAEHRKP